MAKRKQIEPHTDAVTMSDPEPGKDMSGEIVSELLAAEPKVSPQADQIIAESDKPPGTENGSDNSPAPATSGGVFPRGDSVSAFASNAASEIKSGNVEFDPAIHCTMPDGSPRKNKDGTFRLRHKRQGIVFTTGVVADSEACKAAALATVNLTFTMGFIIGGEEWKASKEPVDEKQMLESAWFEYYKATGVRSVPPWLGLVMANCAYVLPRLMMEKTNGRLANGWKWITGKFTKQNGRLK